MIARSRSLRPIAVSLLASLTGIAMATAASAAPISMTPTTASINSLIGNDFTLRLDSGDSSTNVLDFTVIGGGGCGTLCGSTAVAALIFDGTTVLSATDTVGGFFDSSNVVRGLLTPGGAVAGLLIDTGSPSAESFSLTLASTPTTATLYSLNLSSLTQIRSTSDILANVTDSVRLRFDVKGGGVSSVVPEPTAAVVFGVGLLVANVGLRRRA